MVITYKYDLKFIGIGDLTFFCGEMLLRLKKEDILEIVRQEEMNSYLNYVFNRLSMPNNTKTFEEIYDESIELYYERCLKRQQDLEYDNSIFEDMHRFK